MLARHASREEAPKLVVAAPRPAAPPLTPVPAPSPSPTPAPFVVRRILDLKGPLKHGDFVWDESGAPSGPIVITVDLTAQVVSIFRDGYEIGTAAIIYGADNMPTPLGVFPILQKDADHVSNLYDAPMPYMLRLTNDGVAIHASDVRYGNATHGCIGVPTGFAKKLFAATSLGDRVIVTSGKTMALGQSILG
ncbi:L,D-transpeptidase family protein [Sphingomonas sanguinis]|nr:L,D-transpeptidase family protein [Sphingomonas sanguinis]